MDDLNIQAGVTVNAEQAERAFTNLGDKAQKMANEVTKAADKAGKATDGMGDGAEKSADKFTRAESRMRSAIQKSTRELEMLGKTASQKFEAQLEFKGLDKAKFQPFLAELRKTEEAAAKAQAGVSGIGDAAKVAGSMMAAAFSGAALLGVVGKVVSVQREFDVLNSSLKTVTGSSAAAERELAWLKTFAKETPFGLSQATQGFVKMKALGLDPTRASLTSFGNTASAMGKDLNQMIEAVADASTGEFERLKEFGIKASKQGDKVSLTFQGITKTIGNSASEITKYLEDIGNTQFSGAMEERAKTLDGTIAALGDTWDELFRTVSTNNVGGLIFDSVTLANGVIEDATTIIRAVGGAAQDTSKDFGALTTLQGGVATFFETVAVLASNTLYVLRQTGDTMGGLAAGYKAFFSFDFDAVRAIGAEMKANGEAARKEIDATTDRILNARKEQERYNSYATRNASAATDPRRLDLGGASGAAAVASTVKAVKAAVSEYDKLIKKLGEDIPKAAADAEAAQMGYNKAQTEFLALARSPEWAKFTSGQRANVAALFATKIASEQAGDAITSLAKAQKEFEASRQKEIGSHLKEIEALGEKAQKLEDEVKYYGMSQEAIESLTTARMLDQIEVLRGMDNSAEEIARIEETIAARKRLAAAGTAKDSKVAAEKYADDMLKEQKKAAEESGKYWEDALMRAFESGKGFFQSLWDTIKNTFKTQVLKVSIQGIMGATGLGSYGGASGGSGGFGGVGNIISGANSAYSLGSQYFAGTMSGANVLGTVGGNAYAAAGAGDGISGLLATNGAYGTSGAGASGLGGMSALGVAGLFLAAGYMLTEAGPKSTRSTGGATVDYGADGKFTGANSLEKYKTLAEVNASLLSTKTGDGQQDGRNTVNNSIAQQAATLFDNAFNSATARAKIVADTYFSAVKSLGIEAVAASFGFNSNTGEGGTKPKVDFRVEAGGKSFNSGETVADNPESVQLAASRAVLFALQQSELPKYLSGLFDGLTASSATQEQIDNTLAAAQTLKTFNDELRALPFESLASLSFAATQNLIGFSGGLDQLKANLGAYYTNFYSPEEQRAQTVKNINAATAGSGLDAATATREQFRAIVEYFGTAAKLATEDGQRMYSALLGVSGAFAGITEASEALTSSVKSASDQLNIRASLERKLLELQGDTAAIRLLDITGMDAANVALFDRIDALAKEKAASEAASEAARALASANQGIRDRIDVITGAQTDRTLTLRDTPDVSTRTLLSELYKTEDLKAANDAVTAAENTLADARRASADIAADAAQRSIEQALDSRRALAEASQSAAQDLTKELQAVFDTLQSSVRDLYRDVLSTAAMGAVAGQQFIDSALANARASGYLPDNKALGDAISAARGGMGDNQYATVFDRDRDRLVLAGKLSELARIAEPQLSAAEQALQLAKSQLDELADQTTLARKLADKVDAVPAALQKLQDALIAQTQAQTATLAASLVAAVATGSTKPQDAIKQFEDKTGVGVARDSWINAGGTQVYASAGGAITVGGSAASGVVPTDPRSAAIYGTQGQQTTVGDAQAFIAQALAKGDGKSIYDAAVAYGISSAAVDALGGFAPGSAAAWAAEYKLPAFAVGTNYVPSDMVAQIHEGEAIVPKAYNPAANPGMGTGNTERLERLVEGLTAEVQRLQSIVSAGNENTRQLADQFDNVTEGGNATRTVAV